MASSGLPEEDTLTSAPVVPHCGNFWDMKVRGKTDLAANSFKLDEA